MSATNSTVEADAEPISADHLQDRDDRLFLHDETIEEGDTVYIRYDDEDDGVRVIEGVITSGGQRTIPVSGRLSGHALWLDVDGIDDRVKVRTDRYDSHDAPVWTEQYPKDYGHDLHGENARVYGQRYWTEQQETRASRL